MVLSSFVIAPSVSYAQIATNLAGDLRVNVDKVVDINLQTKAILGTSAVIGTGTNIKTDVESDSNSGSENKSPELNSNSDISLNINASGVAVMSSAQVGSDSDLKVFSSNVTSKQKSVIAVDFQSQDNGESEVTIVYRHQGRFLGFIPVTIKSTTIVESKANSETQVHSKMAWWGFLVAKKNYDKSELEAKIKNNATVQANAKVNASAQAKAQIAEAVITEVEANANAQASVK